MQASNQYSAVAKILHWITAILILCVVPLGIAMVNAQPGATQNQLYDLHRSFGALVLTVTAIRLLWRLFSPAPPLVQNLARWQRFAAHATHYGLYVLLFAVPLLGWAGTSAFRAPIIVFGLFELPPIVPQNREMSEVLLGLHELSAFALVGLLVLHVLAAIYHHFVLKDETLTRMLPHAKKTS